MTAISAPQTRLLRIPRRPAGRLDWLTVAAELLTGLYVVAILVDTDVSLGSSWPAPALVAVVRWPRSG